MNKQRTTRFLFRTKCFPCLSRIVIASFILLAGCAQVQPKAEFERARQLVAETTGSNIVYNPEHPLLTDERLDAYFTDGLTLDEAVQIALLNNRRFHAEFLSIGVAKAEWVQAGLLSNPTVGFSIQYPLRGGITDIQASIAQNIVDLWQIPKRSQAAQSDLDATVLRIAHAAATLVTQTKAAYYEAVAGNESLRLAEENLKLTTQSHVALKAQREAGAVSALDENLARGQVLSAELGVRNTRLAAVNAKRRLASQMSIIRGIDNLTLVDPLIGKMERLESEELVKVARQKRLDLRAMECVAQSRLAELGLQKMSVFSDISVGAMLERTKQTDGQTEIDTILGPSLSMAIPIFDQNQAQIAKAQYLFWKELKIYEAEYLQAVHEIRAAVDQAQTAHDNAAFYQQEVMPQAERNLEYSRTSYSMGQTDILTLLEAQRLLLESRRGHLAARLELASAISELEQKVGIPMGKTGNVSSPASHPGDTVQTTIEAKTE